MTTEKLLKYLKENEFDIQNARACLFGLDLYFNSYVNSKIIDNTAINPVFCYIKSDSRNPFYYQIIGKKTLSDFIEKVYSRYSKNPAWLTKKIKERDELAADFDKIWKCYQKNKKDLSKKDLLEFYNRLIAVPRKWAPYCALGEDKGQVISGKITNFLINRHKMNTAEAQEIIGVLTHPGKMSVLNKEVLDYLRISLYLSEKLPLSKDIKKLLEDKKLNKMINEYLKNYFWIKTDFYEAKEITPELLLKQIIGEIKNKKTSDISRELKKINANFLEIKGEKEKILSRLYLSEKERKMLKFAELMVFYQDLRKAEMMKQLFYIFSFIKDVSKKLGISYDQAVSCTVPELRNVLRGKKNSLKKPQRCFVYYKRDKKNKIFYGDIAEKMLKAVLKLDGGRTQEIKGMVASRGAIKEIKGVVRIIYNPLEQKLLEGEILVTSMTRTEFMPLMRKAKAIITDEGGIACHAAIVSRELGIPCIIGTKIATKILKDGDLVEMDTEKGVVKIIKKVK